MTLKKSEKNLEGVQVTTFPHPGILMSVLSCFHCTLICRVSVRVQKEDVGLRTSWRKIVDVTFLSTITPGV